jgi:hypothetical protein
MGMKSNVLIVEVGAEGGSIKLYGLKVEGRWKFSRHVIDQTPALIGDATIDHRTAVVESWTEALELLQRYPWHRLQPVSVHPEFHQAVFDAVRTRYRSEGQMNPSNLDVWSEICGLT